MRRGTAYWVNFGSATPPEIGKLRPSVIVSNSIHNERLDSVVVLPLSTRAPEIWPIRLRVEIQSLKACYAVVPGVRQVSTRRLHEPIGRLSTEQMARIDEALGLYLND